MKTVDKVKRREEKYKVKKIKEYYNAYGFGDVIPSGKREKYIVVLKKQLNRQFYFIIQDKYGNLLLQKFVYSSCVNIVNVSITGKQYSQNEELFDSWFKEAKNKLNRHIVRYYEKTKLGIETDETLKEKYKLVLKKEYDGNYYFVLKSQSGKYLIANLVWFNEYITHVISEETLNKNRRLFANWIAEAKSQKQN